MNIKCALAVIKPHLPIFQSELIMQAWQTLEDSGTQPANVQQLKAEIFRLRKETIGPASEAYINGWNACLNKVCEKLSAV